MRKSLFASFVLVLYFFSFLYQTWVMAEGADRPLTEIPFGTELIVRYPIQFPENSRKAIFSDTYLPWKRHSAEDGTPFCAVLAGSKEEAQAGIQPSRVFKVVDTERFYDKRLERFTATLLRVREVTEGGQEVEGGISMIACQNSHWKLLPAPGTDQSAWVKSKSYELQYSAPTVKNLMDSFGKFMETRLPEPTQSGSPSDSTKELK